jgi:alkanesulfonate monooxygenase SsuD/methylene tetrahydromethanopterin reductase-like flavin-dependent oxidoreductase (luciferase family)
VVSEGRLTLGMGAGWMTSDYEAAVSDGSARIRAAGSPRRSPWSGGLFGAEPFTFSGDYYTIRELDGLPKPAQQPHPPFFIGGAACACCVSRVEKRRSSV